MSIFMCESTCVEENQFFIFSDRLVSSRGIEDILNWCEDFRKNLL